MMHGDLITNPNDNEMANFLLTSVGVSWFGFAFAFVVVVIWNEWWEKILGLCLSSF